MNDVVELAELVVAAPIVAKVLSEDHDDRAVAIVAEEIDARKAVGDY